MGDILGSWKSQEPQQPYCFAIGAGVLSQNKLRSR
jgi:hypothetical protein